MGIAVFPAPSAAALTQKFAEFTTTGTFTAPANVTTVEVLLVAGGGGGGGTTSGSGSGGSGGGGQVVKKFLTVTPSTAYTITIGAGGAGAASAAGSNGSNSSFGSLLVCGGGGGGGAYNSVGLAGNTGTNAFGGSNTGGFSPSIHNGVATVVGGSNGGSGAQINWTISGGGGGAGGPGFASSRDGASDSGATTAGGPGLYGFGAGGQPPARSGEQNFNGNNAPANSGNGAAGASSSSATRTGGTGGSGYCLITYWS